jgi:diguanylate cyclase (GGDEF)-like protein
MISLKKLIDSKHGEQKPADLPPADSSPDAPQPSGTLSAYLAALSAMATSGQRAVPVLGNMIYSGLARIGDDLSRSASDDAVRASRRMVEEQLFLWADKAHQNQKENEQAVKDLLAVVTEAAESTGNRDERFIREISVLCERLQKATGLKDLPVMQQTIRENATALSTCVTKMADEGRESIRKLTSEIAEYQSRLEASERRSMVDPLTGIGNRRGFEEQMKLRIATHQTFSLLVADLNGFKAINDTHGHLAGDDILRQFSDEFKAQFRTEDAVARWGGDEFVAIVTGPPAEGAARIERVRHWALGDYKINVDDRTVSVKVDAAIGTVFWNGTESAEELFARADKEMYRVKESSRLPA